MTNRLTAGSIDEYIAGFPPETQRVLEELRALIKAAAPDATETISYAIPTFDMNGRHLVHFAGYEKHILGQPLPADLIGRIVGFRIGENLGRASGGTSRG